MKVAGSYLVTGPRPLVYEMMQDPGVLARCLPGCDHLERIGPDEYQIHLKMMIASVQGIFAGKVRIAETLAPERFRLVVEGAGKPGFMKGDGVLALAPQDGVTQVSYDGDVTVGGTIAGVGQRLIETTAKLLIRRFFERLASEASGTAMGRQT